MITCETFIRLSDWHRVVNPQLYQKENKIYLMEEQPNMNSLYVYWSNSFQTFLWRLNCGSSAQVVASIGPQPCLYHYIVACLSFTNWITGWMERVRALVSTIPFFTWASRDPRELSVLISVYSDGAMTGEVDDMLNQACVGRSRDMHWFHGGVAT